jgi:hypothetical protein
MHPTHHRTHHLNDDVGLLDGPESSLKSCSELKPIEQLLLGIARLGRTSRTASFSCGAAFLELDVYPSLSAIRG